MASTLDPSFVIKDDNPFVKELDTRINEVTKDIQKEQMAVEVCKCVFHVSPAMLS